MIKNCIILLIILLLTIEITTYLSRKYSFIVEDNKIVKIKKRNKPFIIKEIKEEKNIPKNILQTYSKKENVPQFVFNNLLDINKNYKYHFYDDQECQKYIKDNYGQKILDKYLTIESGPHKADIFRLCWLYLNGGIYIDIDTHIIIDLDSLIEKVDNKLSIPITYDRFNRKRLLNCIIITNKGNPLIKECLENILKIDSKEIKRREYYYLYLLMMQDTLGKNFDYKLKEVNLKENNIYLLHDEEWVILDKENNKIAYSKYKEYDHNKGFIKNK